ncbi:uncharacterized protein LOC142345305 isoform X2 [Convolutriloba macropyga]|uniref:uncharacterized protein LOC142345305 isoform X2 n=1 Tax=Convolutriloba macropyga TaxID=536237 RepID=UPI003F51F9C5
MYTLLTPVLFPLVTVLIQLISLCLVESVSQIDLGDASEPKYRYVTDPTSDQTSIAFSWSLDKENTYTIIELYPEDIAPFNVSNSRGVHIGNLVPGTNYEIHLTPVTQNGFSGDTQIAVSNTNLIKPEVLITKHSAHSVEGIVHTQGRYDTVEVLIEPEPIKFSSSVFDLTGSEQLAWRFDNLLSGHKYVVTAVVKLIKKKETESISAQIELPCSPILVKRQLFLDDGNILMALKVDKFGDELVYNVITDVPGNFADIFPIRQVSEVILKFPPTLVGSLLNTTMTGFKYCMPSQHVIVHS